MDTDDSKELDNRTTLEQMEDEVRHLRAENARLDEERKENWTRKEELAHEKAKMKAVLDEFREWAGRAKTTLGHGRLYVVEYIDRALEAGGYPRP